MFGVCGREEEQGDYGKGQTGWTQHLQRAYAGLGGGRREGPCRKTPDAWWSTVAVAAPGGAVRFTQRS